MSGGEYILGAGVTGLATGLASGFPILEASSVVGGICSSYYIRPGTTTRLTQVPPGGDAYRFEYGGGHWIFGGDPAILNFIESFARFKSYNRLSSVYFPDRDLYVPYPIQNHLAQLGQGVAVQALGEMSRPPSAFRSMRDWLEQSFGPTLAEMFFFPFNDLYTAGLYSVIAPQDAYKSPVNLAHVIKGALAQAPAAGYNTTFVYPEEGLNALVQRMSTHCAPQYGKQVVKIDVRDQKLFFADGSQLPYRRLISTLPLNKMMEMTGLAVQDQPDPYTSVLVLNIGALKGNRCPKDHWLYLPKSKAGFHRVGFYSNVDASFLPASTRAHQDRVSIYVERAFVGGQQPSAEQAARYQEATIKELQEWGFINQPEVVDATWIDVAYTWSYPGSRWKEQALRALQAQQIYQVGRYGRWIFQGIADSIRDGFIVGSGLKNWD